MKVEDRVVKLENELKRLKLDIRAQEIWEKFQKEREYFKKKSY